MDGGCTKTPPPAHLSQQYSARQAIFLFTRLQAAVLTLAATQDIPRLEIPLHTLIELVPKPDGKMAEERIHLDVLKSTIAKACLVLVALPAGRTAARGMCAGPCTCVAYAVHTHTPC